ncbi:hypothetical protein SDC9_154983 [bioreactor metagenome]|uniref:Lipid II flippase MurJ n=1 Tax=bioreactor metagenome TaxID=1076179 RepID=A0A645F2H9_9ZZZZ
MYGKFTELNVQQTAWALLFYALGIPAFCATKVILPTYYARKMMMTPLKISLIAVGVNVILSVLLMLVLGQGGIALATVISAMINNSLLLLVLRRQELRLPLRPVVMTAAKALAASGLGALLFLRYESLRTWTQEWGLPRWMPQDLIPVLAGLVGFGVIYLAVTMILRAHEPWEMFHSFLGRRPPADDGRR